MAVELATDRRWSTLLTFPSSIVYTSQCLDMKPQKWGGHVEFVQLELSMFGFHGNFPGVHTPNSHIILYIVDYILHIVYIYIVVYGFIWYI